MMLEQKCDERGFESIVLGVLPKSRGALFGAAVLGVLVAPCAAAASVAKDWQMGFSEPASPIAARIFAFHDTILLPLIIGICLFVFALMAYACWRFSDKRNKTPSQRTHHTGLEVVWTAIPTLILFAMFFPSFALMRDIDDLSKVDLTVKATGHQWYWSYEYPDHEGIAFDSNLLRGADLKDESKRLLATDNALVLPVGQKVRLLITSADVLHSWAVASFGVKMDAVPGRVNETWVRVDKEGLYYGFCTELCGTGHAYMPIMVEVVSASKFSAWLKEAKKRFARLQTDEQKAEF